MLLLILVLYKPNLYVINLCIWDKTIACNLDIPFFTNVYYSIFFYSLQSKDLISHCLNNNKKKYLFSITVI